MSRAIQAAEFEDPAMNAVAGIATVLIRFKGLVPDKVLRRTAEFESAEVELNSMHQKIPPLAEHHV